MLLTTLLLATTASASYIFNGGNPDSCVTLDGQWTYNGAPVVSHRCDGRWQQKWKLNRHSTQIRLGDSPYCLDAGSNPGNGVHMKIWWCYQGLAAQTWWWTDDDRIAVQDHGQCLDTPDGDITDGKYVQTWQCWPNNLNQVFTVGEHYATEPKPTPIPTMAPTKRTIRYAD